jgi:hypothetical protein
MIKSALWWLAFSVLISFGLTQTQDKPTSSRAKTDAEIMDVVMVDILTAKDSPWEDYSGSERPKPAKRRIRLSIDTQKYGPTEDAIISRQYKSDWDKLSEDEMLSARQAVKAVLERASEKGWLKGYKPKDRRIVVVDAKKEEKANNERSFIRPQVFRAYPPGYTKDGKMACVHLWYPWSGGFHSGVATYVLAFREGKWVVLVRQFIRYV